jgi:hypothetical protein
MARAGHCTSLSLHHHLHCHHHLPLLILPTTTTSTSSSSSSPRVSTCAGSVASRARSAAWVSGQRKLRGTRTRWIDPSAKCTFTRSATGPESETGGRRPGDAKGVTGWGPRYRTRVPWEGGGGFRRGETEGGFAEVGHWRWHDKSILPGDDAPVPSGSGCPWPLLKHSSCMRNQVT